MATPQNISNRADRFITAWTNICFGFYLGFAACSYWIERWHPNESIRSMYYWIFWPAIFFISMLPKALLEIYRGLRKHETLELEMSHRTGFTQKPPEPEADPK